MKDPVVRFHDGKEVAVTAYEILAGGVLKIERQVPGDLSGHRPVISLHIPGDWIRVEDESAPTLTPPVTPPTVGRAGR